MLALVVGVIALTGGAPVAPGPCCSLGLAALAAADVAYTLPANTAPAIPGGDWIEPLYLLGAVCIGAVAWQAPARRIRADTESTAGAGSLSPASSPR